MLPWFERPIIYDVRARPYLVESTTGSHDLQMVRSLFLVLFRVCAFDVIYAMLQLQMLLLIVKLWVILGIPLRSLNAA